MIRSDCTYMRSWQAYKCFGQNYRMLVIESLDADTETRRLSPVAVLGDGFVDLINGERECKEIIPFLTSHTPNFTGQTLHLNSLSY